MMGAVSSLELQYVRKWYLQPPSAAMINPSAEWLTCLRLYRRPREANEDLYHVGVSQRSATTIECFWLLFTSCRGICCPKYSTAASIFFVDVVLIEMDLEWRERPNRSGSDQVSLHGTKFRDILGNGQHDGMAHLEHEPNELMGWNLNFRWWGKITSLLWSSRKEDQSRQRAPVCSRQHRRQKLAFFAVFGQILIPFLAKSHPLVCSK